ncbi:unnamed protein product [Prorocentrum cordatum]|uniref:Uncharacterized protein n=1 Tax=Prorocentrum cordatum TaxID=2364126 RepID=A0ABN9T4P0_9DINO|nr:unnamed protein product [Polarella glacialis]
MLVLPSKGGRSGLAGWVWATSAVGDTVRVLNSSMPYWGSDGARGDFFCALQANRDVPAPSPRISQRVPGHRAGEAYTLRLLVAKRPGFPDPWLRVLAGGDELVSLESVGESFTESSACPTLPAAR